MGAVTFLRRKGFLGGPKMPTSLPVADKSIVGFIRCTVCNPWKLFQYYFGRMASLFVFLNEINETPNSNLVVVMHFLIKFYFLVILFLLQKKNQKRWWAGGGSCTQAS